MAHPKKQTLDSKQKAVLIAKLALDKKAEDIVVLDMRKISSFCDYFVICSGTSDRRIKAIAGAIDEGLAENNSSIWHKEGAQDAHWLLLDTADVIVHIFEKNTRDFYNLEFLWREAPKIDWNI